MKTRNTKQKQIVANIVKAAKSPLTVQDVLARAQRILPNFGIATVYREINRLCEQDKLHVVTIPGDPPRYELAHHHHHHFKCTDCDTVYELEGCIKNITTLVPRGFKHQSHDITLYGRCRACA